MRKVSPIGAILVLAMAACSWNQAFCGWAKGQAREDKASNLWAPENFAELAFRGLGPAVASGRICDLAVDPENPKRYFVAVCSGGVWKTENAGVTFKPLFDKQEAYSIGVVTRDPNNPHTVWVGTGENNSQRSVSWGNGVYVSWDDGESWQRVGLEKSEHIGRILVDPRNSNVVYVAAQGPLWAPGGIGGFTKPPTAAKSWPFPRTPELTRCG